MPIMGPFLAAGFSAGAGPAACLGASGGRAASGSVASTGGGGGQLIDGFDGMPGTAGFAGTLGAAGFAGSGGARGIGGRGGAAGIDGRGGAAGIDGRLGAAGLDGMLGAGGFDGGLGAGGFDGGLGAAASDGMPGVAAFDGVLGVASFGGSILSSGGGFPPSEVISSRPASSTPRSCSRIPASGGSCTATTTAAARKASVPVESCASSRTSVSFARGALVRMKNLFCRSSSPYRAFTSSSVAQGSLICRPIAGRFPPGDPGLPLGGDPGGCGGPGGR